MKGWIVLMLFSVTLLLGCKNSNTANFQNWDIVGPKKVIWYGSTDGPTVFENPRGIDFREHGQQAYITTRLGARVLVTPAALLVELD